MKPILIIALNFSLICILFNEFYGNVSAELNGLEVQSDTVISPIHSSNGLSNYQSKSSDMNVVKNGDTNKIKKKKKKKKKKTKDTIKKKSKKMKKPKKKKKKKRKKLTKAEKLARKKEKAKKKAEEEKKKKEEAEKRRQMEEKKKELIEMMTKYMQSMQGIGRGQGVEGLKDLQGLRLSSPRHTKGGKGTAPDADKAADGSANAITDIGSHNNQALPIIKTKSLTRTKRSPDPRRRRKRRRRGRGRRGRGRRGRGRRGRGRGRRGRGRRRKGRRRRGRGRRRRGRRRRGRRRRRGKREAKNSKP